LKVTDPVVHDHDRLLARTMKRKGFARAKAGLTQGQVAESMGTTRSAESRLEAVGRHSPSVSALKNYARAVGCEMRDHARFRHLDGFARPGAG